MITNKDIEAQHKLALSRMDEEMLLAMAREILAVQVRAEAKYARLKLGVMAGDFERPLTLAQIETFYERVSRETSLGAVFAQEAVARNAGALPKVDFFLPIDNDLPLQAI